MQPRALVFRRRFWLLSSGWLWLLLLLHLVGSNVRSHTRLGMIRECASCHLDLDAQWSESPYNDSQAGRSCQQCHPRVRGRECSPDKTLADRIGAAVQLRLRATAVAGRLQVEAAVCNTGAGHMLPGGAGQSLRLVVEVCDSSGRRLDATGTGSVVAERSGPGQQTSQSFRLAPFATFVYLKTFSLATDDELTATARVLGLGLRGQASGVEVAATRSKITPPCPQGQTRYRGQGARYRGQGARYRGQRR